MTHTQNLDTLPEPRISQGVPIRTAVILAAGMGARLKERGKLMPKSCVRLGEKSIIEESISRLLGVGIQRIVVVTGHLSDQFEPLKALYGGKVELVHNPHFADSGTLYSLYCARHCVDESFLLLEADLVYEHRALTTCLEHPSDNVLLMAGLLNTTDEYFVETRNGNLLTISTNRESLGTEVRGEMVGICKISFSLFSLMLDTAEARFRTTRHLGYEMDWLISAARDVPISCPLVEDLVWCEIDDEAQFVRAREEIYPVVSELDLERDALVNERLQSLLSKFKTVGFFDERELMIRHVRDFFETVNKHQIRACIMFGTLLGKLRHNDFIPWDDDVDVIVFDYDAFLEHCAPELERQGYTIEPDVRDGKRMGGRMFREDSATVPGKPRLRFPWIGIWEHEVVEDGLFVLPLEEERYRPEDFLPLVQTDFLGIPVSVPHDSAAILNAYFGSDDWMEVCQLPYRDHRAGNEPTGFPDDKFEVQSVLDYLASEHPSTQSDVAEIEAERWKYPTLAKPDSDGAYCFYVQRRISHWLSLRLSGYMSPNAATGLDLMFGVMAALFVFFDHWLLGAVFIQVFGVFSCVDGEIARIQGRSFKIGDFLDTLTDRVTELLLVGAIAWSLSALVNPASALTAGLALLGGVFLLTISSEKFRSVWQMAYPKRRLERVFGFFCAGSDSRLLMLSMGLIVGAFTGSGSFLLWLLWALAAATYVNFLLRISLILRHFQSDNRSE